MKPKLLTANVEKRGKQWHSQYECFCGTLFIALKGNVTSGSTRSCGCVKRNMVAQKNATHNLSREVPRLYSIWKAMRQRCNNPRTFSYANYGGRGISIDSCWAEYPAFYAWSLGNGYSGDLSIDRIDVNGNYTPSNCRWATKSLQGQNRRDTVGWEAVDAIRASYTRQPPCKKGSHTLAIAAKYGVSKSAVNNILSGRKYKPV